MWTGGSARLWTTWPRLPTQELGSCSSAAPGSTGLHLAESAAPNCSGWEVRGQRGAAATNRHHSTHHDVHSTPCPVMAPIDQHNGHSTHHRTMSNQYDDQSRQWGNSVNRVQSVLTLLGAAGLLAGYASTATSAPGFRSEFTHRRQHGHRHQCSRPQRSNLRSAGFLPGSFHCGDFRHGNFQHGVDSGSSQRRPDQFERKGIADHSDTRYRNDLGAGGHAHLRRGTRCAGRGEHQMDDELLHHDPSDRRPGEPSVRDDRGQWKPVEKVGGGSSNLPDRW